MNKQEIKKAIEQLKVQIKATSCEVSIETCELAISALQQQLTNGWIPVSERLPNRQNTVYQVTVVRIKDNYEWVQNALWNYDGWKWWEEDNDKIDEYLYKTIAWQPLPEPFIQPTTDN